MLLFLATLFLDQVLFQLFRVALLLMIVSPLSLAETEHSARWKVVNYWSITCAPCRIEIPELNQLREELAQQNPAGQNEKEMASTTRRLSEGQFKEPIA